MKALRVKALGPRAWGVEGCKVSTGTQPFSQSFTHEANAGT